MNMQKRKNKILTLIFTILMVFAAIAPVITETLKAASVSTYVTFQLQQLSYYYNGNKTRAGGKVYQVDGEVAYCVEPSIATASSTTYVQYGSDIPSGFLKRDLTESKIAAMQVALQYGYKGSISYYDYDAVAKAVATQIIVWEIASGCRSTSWPYSITDYRWYNSFTGYVRSESSDSISWIGCNMNNWSYNEWVDVESYYWEISNNMAHSQNKPVTISRPSFTASSTSGASTYTMTWNASKSRYEVTLYDSNGIIPSYYNNFSGSGLSFTRSGNNLTIYTTSSFTGTKTVSSSQIFYDHTLIEYKYVTPGSSYQRLLQVNDISTPVYSTKYAYFKVKLQASQNITIQKTWSDNNNAYSLRPSSVTLDIYKGNSKYTSVTLNSSNSWKTTLSVPSDGSTYTVKEPNVPSGYTVSINGLTATNTIKTKNITITKVWNDNNNANNIRPSSLVLDVYKGTVKYTSVTLTSSNSWKTTLTVPDDGSTYSIKEPNVPNGYTASINGLTATNTFQTKEITITKTWKDNNNAYNTRPNSVSVNIYKDSILFKTEILTAADGWTKTISNLPITNTDGSEIIYTIQENEIILPNGDKYIPSINGYNITNILTGKTIINPIKIWKDDNNIYSTQPAILEIEIYKDQIFYKKIQLTKDNAMASDSNKWTIAVEVDKYNDNGVKSTYTIKEIESFTLKYFYNKVTYDQPNLTVINEAYFIEIVANEVLNEYRLVIGKEILNENGQISTAFDFEKIGLSINDTYRFPITLKEVQRTVTNTGSTLEESYNNNIYTGKEINGILTNKGYLIFSLGEEGFGKYEICEGLNNYFSLIEMLPTNLQEGVELTKENGKYYLTITGLSGQYLEPHVMIKNEIDSKRYFEDEEVTPNLFFFNSRK